MIRRAFAQSCCTTPSAMCFWATAFMLLYGAGLLVGSMWPALRTYTETYLLAALGVACFANFGRNRTMHCGITGPVFVLGAVAMLSIEGGLLVIDGAVVWGVVLIAVGAALVLEWRTVGRNCETTPPS